MAPPNCQRQKHCWQYLPYPRRNTERRATEHLCIGLGTPGLGTYKWAKDNGYEPQLWNAIGDAQANNPATTFLTLSKVKAIDKPDNYSQKTMQSLAKKYAQEAQAINHTRSGELTDNTVIMILSENFSDPTRVPGVSFSLDPIPNIRNIKNTTTSGLMLLPRLRRWHREIEYQALTGLNLANFNDSLIVPYQPYWFRTRMILIRSTRFG